MYKDNKKIVDEAKGDFITPPRARKAFIENQLTLIKICQPYLEERSAFILSELISGENISYVAETVCLTRERVIEIAAKTALKLSNIEEIKKIQTQNQLLVKENERLMKQVSELEERLAKYEKKPKLPLDPLILSKPLTECGLLVRTLNALTNYGCNTVKDLVNLNKVTLMSIPRFGLRGMEDVNSFLKQLGIERDEDKEMP